MTNGYREPEKARMRTTTVRIDNVYLDLIDEIARRDRVRVSDVIRFALSSYVLKSIECRPELAQDVHAVAQAELDARLAEVQKMFGEGVLNHLDFPKPNQNPGEQQ